MLCTNCGATNGDDEKFCTSCSQPLSGGSGAQAVAPSATMYAGFWERFAALILDNILMGIAWAILIVGVSAAHGIAGRDLSIAVVLFVYVALLVSYAAYFIVMESGERGGTFGKRWLKLRVVNATGERIGFGQSLGRFVAHLLSNVTVLVGYLIQPFTSRKQALHDMVSGTVVVKTKQNSNAVAIGVAIFFFVIVSGGILAAIAIPAYRDYVVKAQAVQAGVMADGPEIIPESSPNGSDDISPDLSCSHDSKEEADLLKQAPSGAQRIGEHILLVKTKHGAKRFTDKPPYDEPLDGKSFEYCGYSKELRAHLIGEADQGYFTGTLLFEDTGQKLSAGQTVLIAPARDRYLAIRQVDGKYLGDWEIDDLNGKKIWSGDAGLMEKSPEFGVDVVAAEFVNPQWGPDSSLSATVKMTCTGITKGGKAELRKSGNKWHWVLDVSCDKK